jgi:hypothetical protein
LVQNSSLRGLLLIRSSTSERLFVISAFLFEKRATSLETTKPIIDALSTPHAKLHKRHTALSFHRVQEAVASKYVTIFHLPGEYNPADILSKHWAYASVWRTMNALLFAGGDTWIF